MNLGLFGLSLTLDSVEIVFSNWILCTVLYVPALFIRTVDLAVEYVSTIDRC